MARWHPKKCRVCGKPTTPDDPISARGLCLPHQIERMMTNNAQISFHQGPFFDHWRRRTLAAFGGIPVDEPREGR
jgi:hypothetical protein